MKKILAAAVLAASTIAPAYAQEGDTFTGPYVAAMGGYDNVRLSEPTLGHGSKGDVLYGGIVGYDLNLRGAIFGVEGEYSDSSTKVSANDVLVAGDKISLSTGRDLYAGVRIGGKITDNIMLYGKGGYTNARGKLRYDDGATVTTGSDDLDGYRLGAGVETSVRGLLARVEYRYSSYGHYDGVKVERHQAAVVVGYRF